VFLSFARRWAEPPEPAVRPEATSGLVVARAFVVVELLGRGDVDGRARILRSAGSTGRALPRADVGSEAVFGDERSICMILEEIL
jgi:hypothetical protein